MKIVDLRRSPWKLKPEERKLTDVDKVDIYKKVRFVLFLYKECHIYAASVSLPTVTTTPAEERRASREEKIK